MSHAPRRVLILCTGNSCRSQMAEGLWRQVGAGRWESYSAGSHPAGYVHPLAIDAMREAGIDISAAYSKHVDEFVGQAFDLVVTVCDNAREACPVFPGAKQTLHWPFADPAQAAGTEEQVLQVFREVREQIRRRIEMFLRAESS
ncbi:MAG: arsenate reductase ArsC [Pirellulales bacterium]|nr:arsenate reductase ArsC [Pirellulales bacterium]